MTTQKRFPVDGFAMSAAVRFLPQSYFPLSLGQLDFLRYSTAYRARYYVVPEDPSVVVPGTITNASSTLLYQLRITPGSWLWGFNIRVMPILEAQETDVYVQIGDPCNKTEFWSSPVIGNALRPNNTTFQHPVLIEPRLIEAPGFLNVEITNRVIPDRRVQVIFHCAEPCEVFEP